jgi:hypothetical protein
VRKKFFCVSVFLVLFLSGLVMVGMPNRGKRNPLNPFANDPIRYMLALQQQRQIYYNNLAEFVRELHECPCYRVVTTDDPDDWYILGMTRVGCVLMVYFTDGVAPHGSISTPGRGVGLATVETWDNGAKTNVNTAAGNIVQRDFEKEKIEMIDPGVIGDFVDDYYYLPQWKKYKGYRYSEMYDYPGNDVTPFVTVEDIYRSWWVPGIQRFGHYHNMYLENVFDPTPYIVQMVQEAQNNVLSQTPEPYSDPKPATVRYDSRDFNKDGVVDKYEKFITRYSGFTMIQAHHMDFVGELSFHIPSNYRADLGATDWMWANSEKLNGRYICIYKDTRGPVDQWMTKVPLVGDIIGAIGDAVQIRWLFPAQPFVAYGQNYNPQIKPPVDWDVNLDGAKFARFGTVYGKIAKRQTVRNIYGANWNMANTSFLIGNPFFQDYWRMLPE